MKFSNIRDILAVVEAGSLRAAGRKLGITQPTITRSIRDTENELGATLFTRHGHGVVPTEMGRLFVRRAAAIQSELRHIAEEFEQAKGRFKGQVSVVMSAAASIALMPGVIQKFEKQYPDALLKFSESLFQPIEADIISGDIDFFVGPLYEETTKTSLLIERLFENQRMVVAREGHPLAGATTLADLHDARWIRPSFSDQHDEADFESMFERAGLPSPNIVMHSRSTLLTLLGLKSSDLLTILPIQWLEFGLAGERIRQIKLDEPLQAAPVCVVRRSDLPLTPLAEKLCDMIRKAGANYGKRLSS